MQDLVAPLYAQLLVEAAQRLGPTEAFYRLWPISVPPAPWSAVVSRLYSEVAPFAVPLDGWAPVQYDTRLIAACMVLGVQGLTPQRFPPVD